MVSGGFITGYLPVPRPDFRLSIIAIMVCGPCPVIGRARFARQPCPRIHPEPVVPIIGAMRYLSNAGRDTIPGTALLAGRPPDESLKLL